MSIEIKISKKRISYKMAMLFLNKRVEQVKKGKKREPPTKLHGNQI